MISFASFYSTIFTDQHNPTSFAPWLRGIHR